MLTPLKPDSHIILDSGATSHYFSSLHTSLLEDIVHISPVFITLPDGSQVSTSQSGTIRCQLPLTPEALRAYIIPDMQMSLLSAGKLCDAGCVINLTSDSAIVSKGGTPILHAHRHQSRTKLWFLDDLTHFCGNVIRHDTNAELVAFYHAAFGSPSLPTFEDAVRRGFISIPSLTIQKITHNRPNPMATAQGHLNRNRQGIRSTREVPTSHSDPTLFYRSVLTHEVTHINHADATGRFPIPSTAGSSYMLVFFCEDSNYIHVVPMPSRSTASYVTAFRSALFFFKRSGFLPHIQRLDNEASADLHNLLNREFDIQVRLAPPGNHRTLKAERAIQTFKNHFISTLCTSDPSFPLHLWEHCLPQILLTLNCMRASAVNPDISAYAQMHGNFDFQAHPIAPIGTPVIIYEAPKTHRASWAPHGVPGFYLGTSLPHYRSHIVWATDSQALRITDTVSWHPKHLHLPGSHPSELIDALIRDLLVALRQAPHCQTILPSLTQQLLDMQAVFPAVGPVLIPAVDPPRPLQEIQRENFPDLPEPLPIPLVQIPDTPMVTHDILLDSVHSQRVLPPEILPQSVLSQRVVELNPRRRRKPNPRYALQCAGEDQSSIAILPLTSPLSYRHLIQGPTRAHWEKASDIEFRRLIEDTGCMRFCSASDKPPNAKVRYYKPVCTVKQGPHDTVIYRVRGTVADTRSDYTGPVTALTASYTTIKLLLNATVSENCNWMTADIKDYYLGTPMSFKVYMRIPLRYIPHVSQLRYHLDHLDQKGTTMVEISKGMYGLAPAGRLAQDRLLAHLALSGYTESTDTPCLFKHSTRSTQFTLVVDDFGIKYDSLDDANHLLSCLRELYTITTDFSGSDYVGLTILYDKPARTITVSMPKVVPTCLLRYQIHIDPSQKGVFNPTVYVPSPRPRKGTPTTITPIEEDTSPLLDPIRTTRL